MPTFPTWPGDLPRCLDPWNWRHYFLLLYWIFFRPTALKCYLYRADPYLYEGTGGRTGRTLGKTFANPAYRQLVVLGIGLTLLIGLLSAIPHYLLTLILPLYKSPIQSISYNDFFTLAKEAMLPLALGVARVVALGVVLGLVFGVALGVNFGVIVGWSQVGLGVAFWVSFWVAFGVAFGVALSVAGRVVGGMAFGVSYGVAYGLSVWVDGGLAFGVACVLGVLRLPIYLLERVIVVRLIWLLPHPIWWDELAVLPLSGTEQAITYAWNQGEERGLQFLVRLAANPFQRWVLQRALVRYLHNCRDPIAFVYRLLRLKELEAYVIAPITKSD